MSEAFADARDDPIGPSDELCEGVCDGLSDAGLIEAVRRGQVAAYGVLYARHVGAARRAAGSLGATRGEREDVIAEAFTRVLRVLRAGGGPETRFRPYLFTTMRHAVIEWWRRASVVSVVPEVPDEWVAGGGDDDAMGRRLHAGVAAAAFASLPERWRVVLWRTEIDGECPAQIAALLGMTPNSVAALAYRAREGLRRAYLEQHLPSVQRRGCRTVVGHLAGWVRRGGNQPGPVITHVDRCPDCRALAVDLTHLNHELPAILARSQPPRHASSPPG